MANRRFLLTLATTAALALALSGCGKRGELEGAPPPGPPQVGADGKPKRVEGDPSPIKPPDRTTPFDFLL